MVSISIESALWGGVAGSALLIGAALGYFLMIPQRWVAGVMAFGSGVLISALSFDLMDKAYENGGMTPVMLGFVTGSVVYTASNYWLSHRGAKHRKRSRQPQPSEQEKPGSGLAIAVGSLLDGIPEAIVIGTSMIKGGAVSAVAVVAIFLSNIPEGLSSTVGMKRAGRSLTFIISVWSVIALLSAVSSLAGFVIFRRLSNEIIAMTTAIAAGAILTMISDTMIPEAFEVAHDFAGLITVGGFLCAFLLSKIAGG